MCRFLFNSEKGSYGKKPLSIAVDEVYKGNVKILGEEEISEDTPEVTE